MIPTILAYEQFIGTNESLDTDCKMVAKKCIGYWLLVQAWARMLKADKNLKRILWDKCLVTNAEHWTFLLEKEDSVIKIMNKQLVIFFFSSLQMFNKWHTKKSVFQLLL